MAGWRYDDRPGGRFPGRPRHRLRYGSDVPQSGASDLRELVAEPHAIVLSVIRKDGEHAPMFFLRMPDGAVKVEEFDDAFERPVGEARMRQVAGAIRRTGADAVVVVSEAWSSSQDAIPRGGLPGDARDARDVLVVAALDRSGGEVLLMTDLRRRADGSVEIGETEQGGRAVMFDELRNAWGR